MNRLLAVGILLGWLAATPLCGQEKGANKADARKPDAKPLVLENDLLRYTISPEGLNLTFVDKRAGNDYCESKPPHPFLRVRKQGKTLGPSRCAMEGNRITADFGKADVRVVVGVTPKGRYLALEVLEVSDPQIEEIVLSDLHLTIHENIGTTLNIAQDDKFAACVLALNLKTNSQGHSGSKAVLWSGCYRQFGLTGAKIAVVGCPSAEVRDVLKEVVRNEGLVQSSLGGPWAADAPECKGSYLFSCPSEADIDQWIAMAKQMGVTHLHLCGWWRSLGHYDPQPGLFPHGREGMKSVVAKIHAAGLKAGVHCLTGAIDKGDAWVRPAPDKRLAKDVTFTLAAPADADAKTILTTAPPKGLATESGYWIRGGNSLVIDDEIITYTGISTDAPYGFTGCIRGSLGTKKAAHAQGVAVGHLAEFYATFMPDGESTLVDDLAQQIADLVNSCEFDMIYFDGAEAMSGCGPFWHYVPKMKLEIFRRIKRPCLVESSSFEHHTWPIHSRLGAWDNPCRGAKRFLDRHIHDLAHYRTNLLPVQLGWWAIHRYRDPSCLTTRPEEIEYLCGKCLANDVAVSMQEVSPSGLKVTPGWEDSLAVMGRYERLRLSNKVPETIKAKLRVPKDEFQLIDTASGGFEFLPARHDSHRVTAADPASQSWKLTNTFGPQPLRVRIDALWSPGDYDAPEAVPLVDFGDASQFLPVLDAERHLITGMHRAAAGVVQKIESSTAQLKVGKTSGCYSADNAGKQPGWSRMAVGFAPPVNLKGKGALGVWIHGDGNGEVLNFQLGGAGEENQGDHYVTIDYRGWRYHELVEPEGERVYDYPWPYWHMHVTRGAIPYERITRLKFYYQNIPADGKATCYLSPIRALPLRAASVVNPTLVIGGRKVIFPVTITSGSSLELQPGSRCRVVDQYGKLLQKVVVQGELPTLAAGENDVGLSWDTPQGPRPRLLVTISTAGPALKP